MMTAWMEALLVLGARVMAVLGIALLVTLLMRRASASARHFVWTLAAAAILLLPALTLVTPEWQILPAFSQATPVPEAVVALPAPAVMPAPVALPLPTPAAVVSPAPAVMAVEVESPRPDRSSFLPIALLLLWLGGAAVLLVRMAVGALRMRQVAAGAERVWSGRLHDALQTVARDLKIARPVRLFTRADAMPITWGFVYPAVLLPEVAANWSEQRLDTVLRHELAHVARADAFTQLLADVACALHWYNPLAWYMCARLRMEREHACDDLVLTCGRARPSEYAEELLGLARSYRVQRAGGHAAMAMARPSSLRVRLSAVLDDERRRARMGRTAALATAAAAILLLLPVAGMAPVRGIPMGAVVTQDWEPPAPALASGAAPSAAPAVLADAAEQPQQVQNVTCLGRPGEKVRNLSTNVNDDSYRIKYSTTNCDGDIRVEGKLTFNADFTRLTGISRGGYLRMEEEYNRLTKRIEIEPGASGLSYKYSENGREMAYNAAAQAWQADMLLNMFRRMGFMAEERALAILERKGVEAVLTEVGLMESDHAQAEYLQVVLEKGKLPPAGVQSVLNLAGRVLDSDHYLASLLSAVADDFQFDERMSDTFLAAAQTLESDHYRHQVLTAVLKKGRLSPAQVATVLAQSATIDSDHYRTEVLTSVASEYGMNASVRAAYLRAASEIDSDHYAAEALRRLMRGGQLTPEQLAEVLSAAKMIDSDHYLAELLNTIELTELKSAPLQRAFLDAASSIESDHYVSTVLTRYVNGADVSAEQLQFVLRAARQIDSDHYLSELLRRIATKFTLTGETRDQFMEVLETIESSHYHGQVSSVLLRKKM